jgi:hypothetical protein
MANPTNQNQQLADHIKKNLAKGYTVDSLRFSLIKQGYSRTSIEKSIEMANQQLASAAPKMIEKPTISYQVLDENEMATKVAAQDQAGEGFFSRMKRKFFG